MSTAGIFDEEECTLTAGSQSDNRKTPARPESDIHKYSALWQVTWERIDCFLPNLRQELFTPRSQLPVSNIPKVKPEQEKTVSEESNRAMELPSNSEKLCCYVTNRFQVAVRLYSNRSQMTSKCCKNKKWHTRRSWVCHWCSYHILTSSVIYYCTDARQIGIYLFI